MVGVPNWLGLAPKPAPSGPQTGSVCPSNQLGQGLNWSRTLNWLICPQTRLICPQTRLICPQTLSPDPKLADPPPNPAQLPPNWFIPPQTGSAVPRPVQQPLLGSAVPRGVPPSPNQFPLSPNQFPPSHRSSSAGVGGSMAWLPTSTSGFLARLTSSAHRCTWDPKPPGSAPKPAQPGAKNQLNSAPKLAHSSPKPSSAELQTSPVGSLNQLLGPKTGSFGPKNQLSPKTSPGGPPNWLIYPQKPAQLSPKNKLC